jgi:hypothetical protein
VGEGGVKKDVRETNSKIYYIKRQVVVIGQNVRGEKKEVFVKIGIDIMREKKIKVLEKNNVYILEAV